MMTRLFIGMAALTFVAVSSAFSSAREGNMIVVTDYGAVASDGVDDGPAVRAALEAARKYDDPVIVFPPGRYLILDHKELDPRALLLVEDYPKITLRGEGAEIAGNGVRALFYFSRCGDVLVDGLTVDWDPLPYTGGVVVASTEAYIDLEISPDHPVLEKPVEVLAAVDPETKVQLRTSRQGYFRLHQKDFKRPAEKIGERTLRIYRSDEPQYLGSLPKGLAMPQVGAYIMAVYHQRGGGAFPSRHCGRVEYKNTSVYAVPGMGFAMRECESGLIENCRVTRKPGTERWMSSTVDSSHFNMVRDSVEMIGCVFEYHGDDGSNIHGMYSMVHAVEGENVVVLRGWGNPFWNHGSENDMGNPNGEFPVGDTLEFSSKEYRHKTGFEAKIIAVETVDTDGFQLKRITLDRPLSSEVGPRTFVTNANEVASFLMRDCVVRGNRGQGTRIKTRNALIENCLFEDIHGNGIWIFCDADYGRESIASSHVVIRDNVFRHAARAVRSDAGRKPPNDPEVHEDIRIENNLIEYCGPTPIKMDSVKGLVITGNTILGSSAEPFLLSGCTQVEINDNDIQVRK